MLEYLAGIIKNLLVSAHILSAPVALPAASVATSVPEAAPVSREAPKATPARKKPIQVVEAEKRVKAAARARGLRSDYSIVQVPGSPGYWQLVMPGQNPNDVSVYSPAF